MIPLFPKNGSALTHMGKEKGVHVCPYNSIIVTPRQIPTRQRGRTMQWLPHLTRTQEIPAQPPHLLPAAWAIQCRKIIHTVLFSFPACSATRHCTSKSPKLVCEGRKLRKERFSRNSPKDVHFLRRSEAKLSTFWERNILEHTPPQAVFLYGPGLPGIQSGRIQISACVKRALRKPSRRQE